MRINRNIKKIIQTRSSTIYFRVRVKKTSNRRIREVMHIGRSSWLIYKRSCKARRAVSKSNRIRNLLKSKANRYYSLRLSLCLSNSNASSHLFLRSQTFIYQIQELQLISIILIKNQIFQATKKGR